MPHLLTRALWTIAGTAILSVSLLDIPAFNDMVFRISLLVMVATSWNLMANAGLISLGHSAFWGVGCYASMFAANVFGLPMAAGMLLAIVSGAAIGLLLTVATARLRGFFFAICTLGLSEGLRVTTLMLPDVTGGAVGMFLNQQAMPRVQMLFVAAAIGAVASVAIAAALTRTRFHYACRAMRNHEGAAQMLGVDPRPYRLGVITLAAAMTSYAGGLSAIYGAYIDPAIAFNLRVTVESQIAPILGGMYTVVGPVIGAAVIIVLSEETRLLLGANEGVSQLIFGVILVLAILFLPQGIAGLWTRRFRQSATGNDAADTAPSKSQVARVEGVR